MTLGINERVKEINVVAQSERPRSPEIVQKTKATRHLLSVRHGVFEVQDTGTWGDGVYECCEQTLDATEWSDRDGDDRFDAKDAVVVLVLNLYEAHCNAAWSNCLQPGDRMRAWKWTDDEGNSRWVGIPIMGGFVRQVKTQTGGGASTGISCKMVDQDGIEFGYPFVVYFRTTGGADMNEVWPVLNSGSYLSAVNHAGKWWCTQIFGKLNQC